MKGDHLLNFCISLEKREKLRCLCNSMICLHKIWHDDAQQTDRQTDALITILRSTLECHFTRNLFARVKFSVEYKRINCLSLDAQLALDKSFLLTHYVWNELPATVNFTSLDVLGIALKRLIFLVFLFVSNILLVW